jgi:TolB-like protein/tetratricopeptide (TPR) repeat protein
VKTERRNALRRFWQELRRRHVVRVAVYYAAFAWVVVQVGDVLLEAFELSHLLRYVVAAVVCAFPAVLALSWLFDITPGGLERTPPAEHAAPAPAGSLAVLPFANLSDDEDNEYFSDGLSEEIRNQLARVAGLRVAARTSSFSYKGRHLDVREIGRSLNVAAVLEGGVRKQKDTVRISLQLVSASDGYQIWSENFEHKLVDIFRLQSEIAAAVTRVVSPLSGAAELALPDPSTPSFDAYNLYLLGRHHFHKRTEQALTRAVACFEQAIQIDGQYALAYSGLGDACTLLSSRYYGNVPVEESVRKALPAARRALELAPNLAEAHATLGLIQENQGDLDAAAQSMQRALDLNPAYTMALVWYGLVLVGRGEFGAAAKRNREALQRDPLSPIVNVNVGFDALRYGDWSGAKARFAAAIEIDPAFPVPHYGLSRVYALEGEFGKALDAIAAAIDRAPARAFYRARQGLLLLQAGQPEAASLAVSDACCKSPDNPFDAELVIALYMARGDTEALQRVAEGETRRTYTAAQRGQAHIALGQMDAARALYESAQLDGARELVDLITDEWIWRFPHALNRAHLRLLAGDPRGSEELERLLAEVEDISRQGVANPLAHYWAASACALLGRVSQARGLHSEARKLGWHHGWWERQDWNFRVLALEANEQLS